MGHGVYDALWLLRGRCVVEVDQLLAIWQTTLKNGEISSYCLDIQWHSMHLSWSKEQPDIKARVVKT
jgi:hypothetical protein